MKPSNFKLISDYLTIANVENKTINVNIPGGVTPSGNVYTVSYTFQCKPISQSITRAYIHHSSWSNPNLWGLGTHAIIGWTNGNNEGIFEEVVISTPTDSTIRVDIQFQGYQWASVNVPAHTLTIKAFRFKVPNVL